MMSLFLTQESYLLALRYSCSTSWAGLSLPQSLTTQAEHFTTFLALPSWSILHRPAHSPSFMLESTLRGGSHAPCRGRSRASCTWARHSSRPGCRAGLGACPEPGQPHGVREQGHQLSEPA